MRKLVKILLSLILVAPAAALALGVGDVQLHSALNQRLDGEIKLLSVDPAEADSIEVSLASYDDFARVGLERPSSLMFLRFDVMQSPNGEYYIKLSSREAIRDPFLDFLVEVKWRSGRVLREYTLLLDPPVSHQEGAPAIAAPVTAPSSAAPMVQAQSEEDEFVPPPSSIPVAPGREAPAVVPKRAPAATAASAKRAPAVPAASQKSIVYGPVKANETLWRIAKKLRPNNEITDQQMMMALLIANPYAFIDNNINRLKKGYVLRIDDLSVLTAMSKAEAAREVSRQTRAWQDYRESVAARVAKRKSVSARKEAPSAGVGTAKKEPKLELVSPEGKAEQAGKSTNGADSVKQELMLALESSAAQRKENQELQKRLQVLEEQLAETKRLLTVKNDDLAELQKQLREQGQALTLPSSQAQQAEGEAPVKQTPETAPKQSEGAKPAQTEKAPIEKGKPAAATSQKPAPTKPAVKKPPVVTAPAAEEPSVVDIVLEVIEDMGSRIGGMLNFDVLNFNDPMMMAAGGGAGLLILLLLLVMIRRRRSGGGFQESILTGGTSSMLGSQDDEENSETSFLSDLAISGMGRSNTIDSDEGEVDPLTEADVFMAYGRHQQAEEVLSKALEKHPERLDITAKLLEVYYHLQNADKFVSLAGQSADGLKNQGEWSKIAKWGVELAPQNALFTAGAGAAVAATADYGEPASDVLDIGLDLDELTADSGSGDSGSDVGFDLGFDIGDLDENETDSFASESAGVAEAEPEGSEFAFDLDLGDETVEESAPAEEESGLDFELGGMEEMAEPAAEPDNEFDLDFGSDDAGDESGGMSLDMDFDSGDEPEAAEEETGLDLGELDDLNFGDLGLGDNEPQDDADESFGMDMSGLEMESAEDDLGGDLGDLEGGLGDLEEGLGDLEGGLGDLDDEGMFSDDSDEISTKLDLAQAYIEMGDSDGARSMLEEVAQGGNDEQKQQAQELLARI